MKELPDFYLPLRYLSTIPVVGILFFRMVLIWANIALCSLSDDDSLKSGEYEKIKVFIERAVFFNSGILSHYFFLLQE